MQLGGWLLLLLPALKPAEFAASVHSYPWTACLESYRSVESTDFPADLRCGQAADSFAELKGFE